jgi:HAD superfamily 5'-nucleotidase-like hydrolase
MAILVNRTLDMKRIWAIGFDMDHTLVRYKTERFERLTYQVLIDKLIKLHGYPPEIAKLKFDFKRTIQGVVIDSLRGNILKLNCFGKVKTAYHGLQQISFRKQQKIYRNLVIDLADRTIYPLDSSFSIAHGILYAQLIELLESRPELELPDYTQIADDLIAVLDSAHRDGSLKDEVRKNLKEYIKRSPSMVEVLERFKRHGKRLIIITNSDYNYSKLLLDFAINPYLKEHADWSELFEITITASEKPNFFTQRRRFLKVDQKSGQMTNWEGAVVPGVYQGGSAEQLERDLKLSGDQMLYIGDHIYGDVVSIKKTCNWRTALVLEPLEEEIDSLKKVAPVQEAIDHLMEQKGKLEVKLNQLFTTEQEKDRKSIDTILAQIEKINQDISSKIGSYQEEFNPYWGEVMRAGQEESRFARHVEKYACIYMSCIADFDQYTPYTYFRPVRRVLPHEIL